MMEEFNPSLYEDHGQYDDESNTKVYAMEYVLETLKANPKAIDDVKEFQKTMDTFSAPNPYLKRGRKVENMSGLLLSVKNGRWVFRWLSMNIRTAI